MGLFDWFKNNNSVQVEAKEKAKAEYEAQIRRYADSALIEFIFFRAPDAFEDIDSLNRLNNDEFRRQIKDLIKNAEKLFNKNSPQLDKQITGGLQRIAWMRDAVKNNDSKLFFQAIILGSINYDSKIKQHMLSFVAYFVYDTIKEQGNEIQNITLEKLIKLILLQEYDLYNNEVGYDLLKV